MSLRSELYQSPILFFHALAPFACSLGLLSERRVACDLKRALGLVLLLLRLIPNSLLRMSVSNEIREGRKCLLWSSRYACLGVPKFKSRIGRRWPWTILVVLEAVVFWGESEFDFLELFPSTSNAITELSTSGDLILDDFPPDLGVYFLGVYC